MPNSPQAQGVTVDDIAWISENIGRREWKPEPDGLRLRLLAHFAALRAGPQSEGGEDTRSQFWLAVCAEIDHAYVKHGREPWGRHEFYAIMREEVDEVWDEIKGDTPSADLLKEVVQVAAMCLRYAETGDRYRGEHPAIPTRAATSTGESSDA